MTTDSELQTIYLNASVAFVRAAVSPTNADEAEKVYRDIAQQASPVGLRAVAGAAWDDAIIAAQNSITERPINDALGASVKALGETFQRNFAEWVKVTPNPFRSVPKENT